MVSPVKKSVEAGKGLTVRVTLANASGAEQNVAARNLFVCLATNKPVAPKGFIDPDGRAYWYHQEAMWTMDGSRVWAVREIRVDMDARNMVANGRKIRRVSAEGDSHPIVAMADGGEFSTDVTVGAELPTGKYEVFAYVGGLGLPAMSDRVGFDVVGE